MPRRKSATQGALTKRHIDEKAESSDQSPAKKLFKGPGGGEESRTGKSNYTSTTATANTGRADAIRTRGSTKCQESEIAVPVQVSTLPSSTQTNIVINPLTVSTAAGEGDEGNTSSPSKGEKRNLSLELLCQVGSSELQNITRQSPDSPSPYIIIDSNQKGGGDGTPQVANLGRHFVHIVSDNKSQLLCIQNSSDVTEKGDAEGPHYASVLEISAEEFARLKNETRLLEDQRQGDKAEVPSGPDKSKSEGVAKKRRSSAKPGRHICLYCGRGCAKPSVLQKHLRAHTGERPYPCTSCGFAFKTKSNLYKHCKSRAHALKAIVSEGKGGSATSPIRLQDDGSDEEITDKAEENMDEDDISLHSHDLVGEKVTVQKIEGSDTMPSRVERTQSFEGREQAPIHVLQSVAKYLEKPKEERPKVEIQQKKPESLRPRIATKLKKLKLDLEDEINRDTTVLKLIRSSSVQESRSQSSSSLRRAVSVIDQHTPIQLLHSVSGNKDQTSQQKASGSKTSAGPYLAKLEDVKIVTDKDTGNTDIISLMSNKEDGQFVSVISNKGEDKQFVPISLIKTSSSSGGIMYTTAKLLPKIAPKREPHETVTSSDVSAVEGHVQVVSSEGSVEQYMMHKTSSGGSLSVRPLSLEVLQKGDITRESSKRPVLVKQDAIDIKSGVSEKSIDGATPSSETEIIYLPNANADPYKSLKALRQLENLSEKYKKETIAGYQLLPSIMSFPDGSCQVTLQYIPKSNESEHSRDAVEGGDKTVVGVADANQVHLQSVAKELSDSTKVVKEGSLKGSAKGKAMDSEMLKQRIQDLISRNARIVKTPMAEPPRYKRPTSRQSSEVDTPQSPNVVQVTTKSSAPSSAASVSTPIVHTISLSNFLSPLNTSQVKLPSGELHGIKSVIDSERLGDVKHTGELSPQSSGMKSSDTTQSPAVVSKPPKPVSELVQRLSQGRDQTVLTLGTSGSVSYMPKDKVVPPTDLALKDYKTVITKDENTKEIKINFQIAQNTEDNEDPKGQVKDKIKEKLRASMIDSNKTYCCSWCDAIFSENQVLELHKEYYCRRKHGMTENPSSIISTDKIVKLFSDAGKKTGSKEIVKSYSLGQNFKVVRNVDESGNQKQRVLSVSNASSLTPTKAYKPVQLFRSASVPAHGIDLSAKNRPRFQTVTVVPGSVNQNVYTVVQSPIQGLSVDGNKQNDNAVKTEPVKYKSLLKPADSKPVGNLNLARAITLDMLQQKLGGSGPVLLKVNESQQNNSVEVKSPAVQQKSLVAVKSESLQSIQIKPVGTKQLSDIKQKALEKLIADKVDTQKKKDTPEPPAWKEKLKDKLLRRSMSLDKVSNTQSDVGKATPRTTLEDRKRKFSETRFLSNMITEVRKHKISRYDSAPVFPSQENVIPEIKPKRKKKTAEVCVPVVTAQPVFNFAQINSYRMFQEDNCADGVPRSHKGHAGVEGFWISPAGKYRISKLKAALLGVDSIGNLSEQERLKMVKEWEKEANKAREESESKDIKSKLAKMLHRHKYPSLGWSTNTSFCCLSRPQPMYVPLGNHKRISMYSNWRTSPLSSNPVGMTTAMLLSQYCSTDKNCPQYMVSGKSSASEGILTHSTYWTFTGKKNVLENKSMDVPETPTSPKTRAKEDALKLVKGGHMSLDNYTYVRGRGRGKYVCNECGVRCKKPSMLKKHIRSHTNLRPFKCNHCILSFKTKGNLTKHMNTKSHYRACTYLGINPVPTQVDKSQIDPIALSAQFELSKQARIVLKDGEMMPFDLTNVEDDSDGDDKEEVEEDGNDLDASKDSETMSATEGPSFDESDMDTEVEQSIDMTEEVIPHIPTSCAATIGSGLVSSLPVLCSAIQTQSVTVSMETTVSQSAAGSETSSKSSNILNDSTSSEPTSLGTIYGFENTPIKIIDSEVTKNLPPLTAKDIDGSTSPKDDTKSSLLVSSDDTDSNNGEIIQIPDDVEQQAVDPNESAAQDTEPPVEDEQMERSEDKGANNTDTPTISDDTKPKVLPILSNIAFTVPLGGFMPPMVPASRDGGQKSTYFGPIVGQLVRQPPITLQFSGLPITPTSQSTPVHLPFQFQHPFLEASSQEADSSEITEEQSAEADNEEDVIVENEIKVNLIKVSDLPGQQDTEENPNITHLLFEKSPDTVKVQSLSYPCTSLLGMQQPVEGHKNVTVAEDSGNFKCDLCGKSFTEQQHLVLHRNIHLMEPAYSCSLCGSRFTSFQQCKNHCAEHKKHPNQPFATKDNPRPFRCLECDTGFRTKFHLSRHFKSRLHIYKLEELKIIPQGTYSFIEEILPSLDSYSSEGFHKLLMENLRTRNIIEKLLESEKLVSEMKKRRSSQTSVSVDETKESNEVLILQESRDDTPATFTVVALSDKNKESAEVKNDEMEQGEIINTGAVTSLDDDDKSEVHLCVICNRGFINLQHLKNHMMVTHAELRPYVCEYCDAGFTKAQALKTHLQSHAQERPYVCGMCGETFAESDALKSHNKSKHASAEVDVKTENRTSDSTDKGSSDITEVVPCVSSIQEGEDSKEGNQSTHSLKQESDEKVGLTEDVELSQFVVIETPGAESLETNYEHSKNAAKARDEDTEKVQFSNEDSSVALLSTSGLGSSQKMVGNIRIELNSEFEGTDYDDLDDKLKNDPVFAHVEENEEDRQSSFSGHSSNEEFDQSDDNTQNDHEFRDSMFS